MVDDSDWRLTGQESWLQGATLRWRRWSSSRPDWDHDHCEFCWETFAEAGVPRSLAEGFATEDGIHWICATCFADFRERFGWSLAEADS